MPQWGKYIICKWFFQDISLLHICRYAFNFDLTFINVGLEIVVFKRDVFCSWR